MLDDLFGLTGEVAVVTGAGRGIGEGIAKVLESRWRLDEPEPLDPRLSSVLAEGRETGRWVTFQEMHPSMAKLPSAALVSLAFAQVASGIEMLREDGGDEALQALIRQRPGDTRSLARKLDKSVGEVDVAVSAAEAALVERDRLHPPTGDTREAAVAAVDLAEAIEELEFATDAFERRGVVLVGEGCSPGDMSDDMKRQLDVAHVGLDTAIHAMETMNAQPGNQAGSAGQPPMASMRTGQTLSSAVSVTGS